MTVEDHGPAPEEEAPRGAPEEEIRDRVRDMTAHMLRTGRIDPDGLREVRRAVGRAAQPPADAAAPPIEETFADAIRRLDEAMMRSAADAHAALGRLAERGDARDDAELKAALDALTRLQHDYVAATRRVAEAASGNLQHDLGELMEHAQRVGADASARVATLVSELTGRLADGSRDGARAGIDSARDYGMRMAFLASGMLEGVADALREQSSGKPERE